MLNKKVKGEGLKTLFIYVRVGKGKKGKIKKYPRVKNRKSPKKNITLIPQHYSLTLFISA